MLLQVARKLHCKVELNVTGGRIDKVYCSIHCRNDMANKLGITRRVEASQMK